uniref:Uncharacterized protein n=1 Tax=Melanopsichium pennsylvanicum 4 TaxID=1398559 RepID=A0A077QTF5_9BASI|nr:uncharacterized protein BN887_06096 [Melanopsichium pennsylvanicum 4]
MPPRVLLASTGTRGRNEPYRSHTSSNSRLSRPRGILVRIDRTKKTKKAHRNAIAQRKEGPTGDDSGVVSMDPNEPFPALLQESSRVVELCLEPFGQCKWEAADPQMAVSTRQTAPCGLALSADYEMRNEEYSD